MSPFTAATEEVARNFKTEHSSRWVYETGRRQLVNDLLDSMENAQSQQQFNALAYQFKRDVLMPYYREVVQPNGSPEERSEFIQRNPLMQMRPQKDLGSYADLQRNPAFAQSRYKYLPYGSKDSVPALLRMSEDPAELDLAARELQMTPEDLQAYIQDRYNRQAREQFSKDMRAAAVEGQRFRDSVAKEYEDSMLGTVLGTISPEVTGYRLKEMRTGQEGSNWDFAKAIAKDALIGIGSIYAGAGAGALIKNPAAAALGAGVVDAGLEAARQGMSDYSDWDLGNIAATGWTSTSVPAFAGMATGLLGKVPGLRRFTRPLMKKIYGIDTDPAATEAASVAARKESTRDAILKAESGEPIAKELETDALDDLVPFMEQSPTRAYDQTPLTRDEVRDIVMDPERSARYFNPPTAEEFQDMIVKRNLKGAGDVIDVNGTPRFESDVAEDWLGRAKAQWPENWKASAGAKRKPNWLERRFPELVDVASREETARQRRKGKMLEDNSVSVPLQQVMERDPDIVRMWKAGFVPNDDAGKKLYEEWKAKFGE